ncbi:MAG: hypothetical protein ABF931_09475 [Acetobacter pasteurianus]
MSTVNDSKKKIGRPRVDSEAVNIRLQRPVLNSIDQWAMQQKTTRAKAIKQLIEEGLIRWLQLPLPTNPHSSDPHVQIFMREAYSLLEKSIVQCVDQGFQMLVPSPTLKAFFTNYEELEKFASMLGCQVRPHEHTNPDGTVIETQIFFR